MEAKDLNKYQKEIVKYYFENLESNMLINALAGTGKSTTAKTLLDHTPSYSVYLAFNTSIANEFKRKMKNPKVRVSTLHALSYSLLVGNVKDAEGKLSNESAKLTVDYLKIYRILDSILAQKFKNIGFEQKMFLKENYVTLFNLLRTIGKDFTIANIEEVVKEHNLFQDFTENCFPAPEIGEIVSTIKLINSEDLRIFEEEKTLDFTDMLYITYLKLKSGEWHPMYYLTFFNIIVDEVQDLSNVQLFLLKYFKRKDGRFVFLGDANQAIYMFSGANSQAFNSIPKLFAPVKQFDLPITYRCPLKHIKEVKRLFGIELEPKNDAIEGSIKTINKKDIFKYIKPGDMIISRKNKWFGDIVLELAKKNIPVYIGNKDMVDTIDKKTNADLYKTVSLLINSVNKEITNYYNNLHEKMKELEEENSTEIELETIDTNSKIDALIVLKELAESFNDTNKKDMSTLAFKLYLKKVLNTNYDRDAVKISSVHKAKGLEAKNVFVLNEGKVCYSPLNSKEQNQQEKNLSYISYTRSKENLYLVREEILDEK